MRRSITLTAAGLLTLTLLTGCGQQMRAERDGRDLAEAVCDLREATDETEVESALADIEKQVDDLTRRYGASTAEDRADVQNNLADLAEHRIQGNEVLMQQDLAVLQRSIENIEGDVGDVSSAARTGFADGLNECLS